MQDSLSQSLVTSKMLTTNGSAHTRPETISLYGRTYSVPNQPTVVICIDGFDPSYLTHGIETKMTPTLASFVKTGFHAVAKSAMPSLTNPNNLSIITGQPTVAHGISGNYYLDKLTGEEHMITDTSQVVGSTILAELSKVGVRVAAVTAKDKLRKILCHGIDPAASGGICFSAQNAKDATLNEHGIEDIEGWLGRSQPEQYSGELSLFVLDAGLKLLKEDKADVFYLTLSDFIQHKYAPGETEADEFYCELDKRIASFVQLGAVVAITGDHGMSDKSDAEGNANVLFVEDVLNKKWPEFGARVICPIADPFVKHHGALGGFVRVYFLKQTPEKGDLGEMIGYLQQYAQVEIVYTGQEAAKVFEMPPEHEGDLVVISVKNAVLGSRADEHDLEQLKAHRLRSHGGLSEQEIPLLRSAPLQGKGKEAWRNFDVFDVALNYWT